MATDSNRDLSGYRISPVQEGLWEGTEDLPTGVRKLLRTEATISIPPSVVDRVDPKSIAEQIDRLVARYEILRSKYLNQGGRRYPLQIPQDSVGSVDPQDGTWDSPRLSATILPEDGSVPAMLRLSAPCFIADPHTLLLLAEELLEQFADGEPDRDVALQYAQYAEWSRQFVDDPEPGATEYWEQIGSADTVIGLISPHLSPVGFTPERLQIGRELLSGMQAVAGNIGVRPEDVPILLWGAFLLQTGRGGKVRLHCNLSGRDFEELAGVVGPVGRTVPLVIEPINDSETTESFENLMVRIAGALEELRQYADSAPASASLPESGPGYPEAGIEVVDARQFDRLQIQSVTAHTVPTVASLSVLLEGTEEAPRYTSVTLHFDSSRIDRTVASDLASMFVEFVRDVSGVGDDSSSAERLPEAGAPAPDVGQTMRENIDLLSLIDDSLRIDRQREVIRVGERSYTRADLDGRASAIADALTGAGVSPGDIVPFILDRSFDAVATIIGILRTGAAFLPVDPELPDERISFMVAQSRAGVVIGNVGDRIVHESSEVRVISLRDIPESGERFKSIGVSSENPAYVIFTSGSTGQPKGCVIRRRNISSYVNWALPYYLGDSETPGTWPLFTSLSFDLTLTSIFLSVAGGGRLYIYPRERELPDVIREIFSVDSPVNMVKMTPGHVTLLESTGVDASNVRGVILGGEQLLENHLRTLRRLRDDIAIHNEYGPTETTIGCTVATIAEGDLITIGRPIAGADVQVLDFEGNQVRPFVQGEIWIAGDGTGAGYLNRDEVTAERFRSDVPALNGKIAYRSGDLAWRYPDGTIVYVGRNDDQVKVRGYRIEPGEIRSRLVRVEGIRDGVVLPCTSPAGDTELVAYYVTAKGTEGNRLTADHVRAALLPHLPEYMVPQFILEVEAIPLTINGKPDQRALPDPYAVEGNAERIEPETETERWLASIWRELLGIDWIGVEDDFFRHGGHSLLAMRMIARINLAYGTDLKIRTLFENPTIGALAPIIEQSERAAQSRIGRTDHSDEFELSDAQRRLWVLEKMEDVGATYHIYGAYDIHGELDGALLEKAFTQLVQRHPTLRTTFPVRGERPVQQVHQIDRFDLQAYDLRSLPEHERSEQADAVARRILEGKFNLEIDLPVRGGIIRLGEEDYRLLVSMHHLVSDGWSVNIMIRELVELYDALLTGRSANLPELTLDYADFVEHQRRELEGPRGADLRNYWLHQLADAPPLDLPIDLPRSRGRSYRGSNARLHVDSQRLRRLEEVGTGTGTSLFMVLVSLLDLLFYRYSGETDITIGTAIAGRDHAELESQIGFYVNILPLRVRLQPTMTFGELLEEVRRVSIGAFDHQAYPFDRLVDELGVEREVGRSPLFDTFIVLQNPETEELRFGNSELREHPFENRSNAYDLAFNCELINGELDCAISYNSDLYLPERITGLIEHLESLIDEVTTVGGVDRPLRDLRLFPASDLHSRVERWTRTELFGGRLDRSIVDQVDTYAEIGPDREAVSSDTFCLTYDQLRRKSNGVAHYIREAFEALPEGDDDLRSVAVLLPRCGELPLLFMAIRKAGGVYVPIDNDFPRERVERMLLLSGASIVITDADGAELLGKDAGGRRVILLEELEGLDAEERPAVEIDTGQTVAVFFTSGSTGLPKGVRMYERGLNNASLSKLAEVLPYDRDLRGLHFASPSFDASLVTMLVPLLAGGTVVVFDRDTIENRATFIAKMQEYRVSYAILPPSYLATLDRAELPSLHCLSTAGEPPLEGDAYHYAEQLSYINAYGPAECSICVSIFHLEPGRRYPGGIPIGRELPNTVAIVVDSHGNILPEGIDGELWVGGTGVGPGYLQVEDTVRSYVEHPWLPGRRFYRTGDVVRRGFDGNLIFRGRIDNQVKIRGHRVEPNETALALSGHPEVADAAVVPFRSSDGQLSLVAWIVPANTAESSPVDLVEVRAWLADRLPSYMIPSRFFTAEELPLSASDKVDLVRLGEMTEVEMNRQVDREGSRRPSGEAEELLCRAVADVLGLDEVSPEDNYFMLGGDSIRAIQVTWRLQEGGYRIEVRDLFSHPLLCEAATTMTRVEALEEEGAVVGNVPLHPIQRWFFENVRRGAADRFNQSTVLRWRGGMVDVGSLETGLRQVLERHDMLRARYVIPTPEGSNGEGREVPLPQQIIDEVCVVNLEEVTVSMEEFDAELLRTHQEFDLAAGGLFRTKVIRVNESGNIVEYVQFVAHHLIVDVVSWHVLLDDLFSVYGQSAADVGIGSSTRTPLRGGSYRAWVRRMEEFASSTDQVRVTDYWRRIAESISGAPQLPVDFDHSNRIGDVEVAEFSLPSETTAGLVSDVHHVYNTDVRDLLVAALGRAIRRETGGQRVLLGLEGHGRDIEQFDRLDVSRTVGWFTSLYPVMLEGRERPGSSSGGGREEDIPYTVKQAKEAIRSLPMNGAGYGIARYLVPPPDRLEDLLGSHAQVTLNYLGLEGGAAGGGLFEVCRESPLNPYHPDLTRKMEIDILATIRGGEFTASLMYVPGRLREGTVETIGKAWMEEIQATVDYLRGDVAAELTPSDVDYDGLSIDDLDDILSKISSGEE